VKGITTDAIYDRQYWEAVRGRSAGSCRLRGVNGAVNSGPARSIMWLSAGVAAGLYRPHQRRYGHWQAGSLKADKTTTR